MIASNTHCLAGVIKVESHLLLTLTLTLPDLNQSCSTSFLHFCSIHRFNLDAHSPSFILTDLLLHCASAVHHSFSPSCSLLSFLILLLPLSEITFNLSLSLWFFCDSNWMLCSTFGIINWDKNLTHLYFRTQFYFIRCFIKQHLACRLASFSMA